MPREVQLWRPYLCGVGASYKSIYAMPSWECSEESGHDYAVIWGLDVSSRFPDNCFGANQDSAIEVSDMRCFLEGVAVGSGSGLREMPCTGTETDTRRTQSIRFRHTRHWSESDSGDPVLFLGSGILSQHNVLGVGGCIGDVSNVPMVF